MKDFIFYSIVKGIIDFFISDFVIFIFGMFCGVFIFTLDLIDKGFLLCEDLKILF